MSEVDCPTKSCLTKLQKRVVHKQMQKYELWKANNRDGQRAKTKLDAAKTRVA